MYDTAVDPSEKLSKVQLPEIRGRARSRPESQNGQWRSNSGHGRDSLAFHRVFMQEQLLGEISFISSRTKSQTRYHDVANVIHLDKPRVDNWEEGDTTTPGLIWQWRTPNISNQYQYKPLQRFTDFRLLHILPAANRKDIVRCGFTRHDARAVRRRFVPFLFVEDAPVFYGSRSALVMLNGLPFFVPPTLEAMLKSIRRSDTTMLLFNRSICIGEEYRVYEAISTRWNAEELENEVRQLCTLRRLRSKLELGLVLTWREASGLIDRDYSPYEIHTFNLVESSIKLAPAYRSLERSEKPAVGARKDSVLRVRWTRWTGDDGKRPWARQLHCRSRSADSGPSSIEPFKHRTVLPPSETPFRRSRSEQRGYEAIRWRGREMDMDDFWDGLFFTHPLEHNFLWNCTPLPLPWDLAFNHSNIDYDKEIVLAQVLDDRDSRGSPLRFGLLRFRWDRVPQFVFIANSMAFNPYLQATIQINGQFARISRSLEVCLRSLLKANLSTLIFAWPLCVPLHRMIDTSWLDAFYCTFFNKTASIIDAQSHLASLSAQELDRCIRESHATSKMYKRYVDAWSSSKRGKSSMLIEEKGEGGLRFSDRLSSPLEQSGSEPTQWRSESITEDEDGDTASETSSISSVIHWQESIWKEERDIPTVAFRDFDRANKIGQLGLVRDTFGAIYCPLDPVSGDVRLIAVLPEDPQTPSRLELQIESREMNWGYIAVSYCWGSADDQQEITVNGNAVSVRRNLYDFLMFFREGPLIKEGRGDAGRFTLWIDALSINQGDKREKAREVRRMNRIYEEADFVLVWLGLPAAKLPWDVTALLEDPQANESELRQVAEVLVGNQYFFRAWCTQELAVNGEVYVCIGTCWLNWMTLVKLVQVAFVPAGRKLIECLGPSDEDLHVVWLLNSGSAVLRFDIISWLRYRLHCEDPPTLLSLLAATSHCDCSVRSDQIYSLWALARDTTTLLSDIDYLKPAKDVFRDFARSWMLEYKRCDILAFAESPDTTCTFDSAGLQDANPSWIPDWTLRRSTWPLLATWTLPTTDVEVDLDLDDIEYQWLYDASKNVAANVKFLNTANGLGLLAAGIRADTIVEVLEKFSGLPNIYQWHESCLSWLEGIRRHFKSYGVEDADRLGVYDLLEALVAGRYYDGTKRTGGDCSSYLALGQPGDHILVAHEVDGHADVQRFDTDDNVWVSHVMRVTAGRRLAITRTGHVGLVPGSTEVGDEVVVIFGCSVPLLFRRQEQSKARRVIGECYFERMMDGQVVKAAGDVEIPSLELPSSLVENETSASKAGSLGSMESLSELLQDPSSDDRSQVQWFYIV